MTPRVPATADDPRDTIERLIAGDRLAFARVNRLVSSVLAPLRVYDAHDEWDALRRDVVARVAAHARAGRLRDPSVLLAYVRIVARNAVVERLRTRLREGDDPEASDTFYEIDPDATRADAPDPARTWSAVATLSDEQRRTVEGAYWEGKSLATVAAESGASLAATRERLRGALALLRERQQPREARP